MRYVDRVSAGRALAPHVAEALPAGTEPSAVLVLGVPRGGVIVAAEVAHYLAAELNIALARKIGAPGNPELAIGAVGENGEAVWVSDLIADLAIAQSYVEDLARVARREIEERLTRYREVKPAPVVEDRVVVVVDDGIATGATLRATLQAVRAQRPRFLLGAVPVGPPDSVGEIAGVADAFVCPLIPRWFRAVGEWYDVFVQTTDEQVLAVLE